MPESKSHVKEIVYEVHYICDECEEGEMKLTDDVVYASQPPIFPHKCTKCGAKQTFLKTYPYIERDYEIAVIGVNYG